ncbi:hypothetical protein [Streptomyces sparsogenes]|uniref:hypothetical protein n=1 Tax=Streptomyces sparsogenes TaxID=67365 RepID=UPI0033F107A6
MTEPTTPAAMPSAPADQAAKIRAAAFRTAALFVRGHSADERFGKASSSTALCTMSDELLRMADEVQPGAPAATTPYPCRALLARLEAERARSAQNAADSRREDVARAHEGGEGAFRTAVEYTIQAFWGLDAAVTYQRDGVLPQGDAVFVPPPPGSTEEQLPADVLALIDPPPYLSTACGTAQALEEAVAEHPDRQAGLEEWARRMHDRCRINHKFTGKLCTCGHHQEAS